MDTPWLYVYMAHKLSQPQRRALQFSSEVTARKWMTIRSLVLEGSYREKGGEREGRLQLHTPTDTYLKVPSGQMPGTKVNTESRISHRGSGVQETGYGLPSLVCFRQAVGASWESRA